MSAEPWQRAEIPGPLKAMPIRTPEDLISKIKKFKRPIIIVGHFVEKLSLDDVNMVDVIIELAKAIDAPIVVTSTLINKFREKGYENVHYMPAMEIADRLRDPDWEGLDGNGRYDLAIFIGFQYYYEWLMLSGLKHFAYTHLKTLSLDPQYQPHATWSLLTMPDKMWNKFILTLTESLKKTPG